ncbi:MAG TPA: asparagine synthase-related protein [Actinomycetota bacterium]|nr:asparagine synthase-related protein [Actinomycetota bacterium]
MSGFYAATGAAAALPDGLAGRLAGRAAGAMRSWSDEQVTLLAFEGRSGPGLAVADDLVVALDGRIDEPRGTAPAADRLLNEWRRDGAKALDRLAGDFAGAVYDRRATTLTVLRDPCAGRPAILGQVPGGLVAASTVPMLLEDPRLDREIDPEWVAAYLTASAGFATATGYRAMTRLIPGAAAEARGRDWTIVRRHTWRPAAVRERTDQAYADGLRERLVRAIEDRTAGASRIGISLSGGLDSTSIAALLRRARPDAQIVALAVPFTHPRGDERALQKMVAERIGAELRWAPLDGTSPYGASAAATLDRLGQPPIAPNHFFVERVAAEGRAAGVEVAMDGIDGDAVVGGNWFYLADLLVTGRLGAFRRELAAAARIHGVARKRIVKDYVAATLLPDRLRALPAVPDYWDPAFVRKHRLAERLRGRSRGRPGRAFRANELAAMAPDVAPAILEQIGLAWGPVEVSHPFLDRRVVEYCLGLPRKQKVSAGVTKIVLRNALRGLLPPEVAERSEKAELGKAFFEGLKGPGAGETRAGLVFVTSNLSEWVDRDRASTIGAAAAEDPARFDLYRAAFLGHWQDRLGRQRPDGPGRETLGEVLERGSEHRVRSSGA